MLRTPVLTDSQLNDFKRDGYLVLRQAFDAPAMALIEQWTREIAEAPEVPGRQWVYHERSLKDPGELLINRIERISPFHDGFRSLTEALRVPVGQLLGEQAVLFKEKINFKMPGGGGFKPHQDSQAGWEDYASYFISALVCIDEATVENGCLQMVAGHQHRGLFRSWEPLTEADMAGMAFEYCPTSSGDVVFFDSYAPHASEANLSDRIRRIYFATYNRLSEGDHLERYYADKHRSFPPDIEREAGKDYVFRV
jgi:2-aminoethylphosphonate dioxygenase